MSSPGSGGSAGRKRTPGRQYSAEDQALNQIASEAENRLAARRAARAEAREIRLRELERQQKEEEDKEKHSDASSASDKFQTPVSSSRFASTLGSTRRGSNDSLLSDEPSTRELRREVAELEEKYRKAMTNNAQLDTEKQTYRYQADVINDQLDDHKEGLVELQRLYRLRGKELDQKKREFGDSQEENEYLKYNLSQRDELIKQYGLVFINNDTVEESQATGDVDPETGKKKKKKKRGKKDGNEEEKGTAALVTPEAAQVLQQHEGNLDDRLKKFAEEQEKLMEENKKLKMALEQEKEKSSLADKYPSPAKSLNGPGTADIEALEQQMEIQKQLNDYKFKLQKAEQEITTFEGNVIRLESQVKRFRQASESAERQEEEIKAEKRRLQRELRESQSQLEEVQTQNHHLQKRMERIKSSRNANI